VIKLQGIFPALATPFDHNGELYRAKIAHNIARLNSVGLAGYVVAGSTGESPLLSADERLQLFEWVRENSAEGKILIAGTASEGVHETVALVNRAADMGYHAALVLGPRYYKNLMHRPETQALFYRSIADRAKIPILLYNFPNVSGYDLPVETIAALSEHPNIAGMKDSSANLEKLSATVAAVKPRFQVLSGSGVTFGSALKLGATGAILAFANAAPYACVTIWEAFRTREYEAAEDWQKRIFDAARLTAPVYGIPGLEHAMDLNGYYGGPPRLPLVPCGPEARAEIEQALEGIKS